MHFFIKVKLQVTVLNDLDIAMVGFREAGTTQVTTTSALAKTDYDHKALYGMNDDGGTAGAVTGIVSTAAGSDTETTATKTPIVTGTDVTFEVRINKDLTCNFLSDGVNDVLVEATSPVVTTGKVFVPHIILVGNGVGAEKVEFVTYECGLIQGA